VIISLRALVDKHLDRPLSDSEWNHVQNHPSLLPKYRCGEIDEEGIAETVRQLRRAFGPQPLAPSTVVGPLRADPARRAREELLSYLFSLMAARFEKVETFRSEVLGGKLLKVEEVEPWIREHAHEEKYTVWLQVPVRPDARNSVYTNRTLIVSEESPATDFDLKWLKYILPAQKSESVPTAAGGALDKLRIVSEHVATQAVCSADYATTFILSGEPLPFFSCEQSVVICSTDLCSALNRIELKIDPTLSPRQVAQVYRQLREKVFGRRYRAMSEKHIRLALFTFSRPPDETLKSAMGAWNKLYPNPKWRYRQESNFGRDRVAAKRRALETLDSNPTSQEAVGVWRLRNEAASATRTATTNTAHKRRARR